MADTKRVVTQKNFREILFSLRLELQVEATWLCMANFPKSLCFEDMLLVSVTFKYGRLCEVFFNFNKC